MAIVVPLTVPGAGAEAYAAVVDRLTGGKGFTSLSDVPAPGLVAHIAGPVEDGWRVIDVWDSPEAFEAFSATLRPIVEELGIEPSQPQITPAHNVVVH
ncbi:hypothetical protein [Streptomyces sp. UNOC14_S4]|uniref:hypothetical protein n=1 Tax=Streptomyces sp. UNOC14_S4 TaxID=2872340 RepID=UPI001E350056|nr:hypothetical protein [Streptomyces sp. UNOC14_S4]MCC3768313.1 hypothetical protein [Streptomyces sp. UNOC14_S4]